MRLEELCVSNLDFSGQSLKTINARSSVFEGVCFSGCTIAGLRLRDVRMIRCDLSNAEARAFDARRVEFVECRLSGLRAFECRWQDVLVENCLARYAQFNEGILKLMEFRSSQFDDSDFRGADLSGAVFDQVVLTRADLTGARLEGADLRGAELEGVIARPEDVRGAIVTPAQAMGLARLLGLDIR
jgi:uncharacterized protein YjbI with pentapeptide repeats